MDWVGSRLVMCFRRDVSFLVWGFRDWKGRREIVRSVFIFGKRFFFREGVGGWGSMDLFLVFCDVGGYGCAFVYVREMLVRYFENFFNSCLIVFSF